jgi:IS5 family transposase
MMFKYLLLQSWYALGDPKLEICWVRDLLFKDFIGLSLCEDIPDHVPWRFRNVLSKVSIL